MPECQQVRQEQEQHSDRHQEVDGLRYEYYDPSAKPIRDYSGDKTDDHQRQHAVEADKGHVPRGIGHLQNEPPDGDVFQPPDMPPEPIAYEKSAIVWNAQERVDVPQDYPRLLMRLKTQYVLRTGRAAGDMPAPLRSILIQTGREPQAQAPFSKRSLRHDSVGASAIIS